MAAKTTKENQHFLDMLENSKFPELGLIGAKLVDLEENALDRDESRCKHDAEVMKKLNSIETNQTSQKKDIASNTKRSIGNSKRITKIEVKDTRFVAVVGLVATICTAVGGIVGALIAVKVI
jgi:hypothetical protein